MVRRLFIACSIFSIVFGGFVSIIWVGGIWVLVALLCIVALGAWDMIQRRHTVRRIYPVIGRLRYLLEGIRPELQQYFVESDIDGVPINREFRSLVYQRAKQVRDTRAFGTVFDVYRDGSEWLNHSLNPKSMPLDEPRIKFGGAQTEKPYTASLLNISAMSFGALSQHAVVALNQAARRGEFAHNTGEGGLSPYHLQGSGDLIWQIGTGYFGCRTTSGEFDANAFQVAATQPQVKMIELKLSQGAKPGHGGILPAAKLTPEIAKIRLVDMGHDVISPPAHTAFETPTELLQFVQHMRELSGGKPVGFKLCVGDRTEFLSIGKGMLETGITPDFITVDGSEGGSGAAPIELTNSVGTPMREGLAFIDDTLIGLGLRDRVRIISAGKVFSAFHMARALALGADTINSARAMMLALGCIQSRRCNSNTCPTGIATQDPERYRQLDIEDKTLRVASYHAAMIYALNELIAGAGLSHPAQLKRHHIIRRVDGNATKSYAEIFEPVEPQFLLKDSLAPPWANHWNDARADVWPIRS